MKHPSPFPARIPAFKSVVVALLLLSTLNLQLSTVFAQGSLTPPGAPAPTMKTLDQVEPRIPISSLPFTITNSGSYYLTASLIATGATHGIIIQANLKDVTVDLNGFALIGGSTSGDGVSTLLSQVTNIVVVNGTVRNWDTGLALGGAQRSRFERLQVVENRSGGLGAGADAIVRQCTVLNNGSATVGIQVSTRGVVSDCNSSGHTNGTGIIAGGSSTVTRCTVESNGGVGISVGAESEVSHCRLVANPLDGIRFDNRCVVLENFVRGTGTATGTNACIHAMQDSNRIEANHVIFHQIGIKVDLGSSLIIRNSAYFNQTNYVINVNNQFGPTSSGSGVVTNHPWGNFSL